MRINTVGTLGELARDQRKQRGWSQSHLAEKVGVSRLWVGQFENGKETVELGLVLKTMRALDLSLEAGLSERNPSDVVTDHCDSFDATARPIAPT